jgi:two-component system, chemotaxis family, protein-glutamate methylesterase/glutaminase
VSLLRVAFVGPEEPPRAWIDRLEAEAPVEFVSERSPLPALLGLAWVERATSEVADWIAEAMRRPRFPLVVASPEPLDEAEWTRRGVVLVLRAESEAGSGAGQAELLRLAAEIVPVAHPKGARAKKPASSSLSRLQLPVAAVAASTGGPRALADFLGVFGRDTPGCLLLVQHMGPDFVPGLREVLQRTTELEVVVADEGQRLRPGVVFLAPADHHLVLASRGRVGLQEPAGDELHTPSADVLLSSVAATCGVEASAVVLSGMGRDGASGAQAVKLAGGRVYTQSAESCVIAGMPGATELLCDVDASAPPDQLGRLLAKRFRVLKGAP